MAVFKDFKTMIEAQEALNNKYVPNWRESVSLEQKLTAVFTEMAEWFESAPRAGGVDTNGTPGWCWWKRNKECDVQNKKIEVIDVWHFMMSTWLLIGSKQIIEEFVGAWCEHTFTGSDLKNILKQHASYTVFTFEGELERSVYTGMNLIFLMMRQSDMTWEDLERGYFLKNNLNSQRVEGGYQDGNYSKHDENGEEDNRKLAV